MKRTLPLLVAVLMITGACLAAWRRHERKMTGTLAAEVPLTLDKTTINILTHPTKIETFRLADFHEGEMRSDAERAVEEKQSLGTISGHTVLRVGRPQDAIFAARLASALSSTVFQKPKPGQSIELRASCFDPGVAFRVWKGAAHTDVCICFYCSGADIVTKDSAHRVAWQAHPDLGPPRAALLALSVQAFPDDARLLALKSGQRLPYVVN